jgi:hypothetical protein
MGGRLRSYRAAADSAYSAIVQRTIDDAANIRARATAQLDSQTTALASLLCAPSQGKNTSADSVRTAIRQELEKKGIGKDGSLCGKATRADSR